MNEDERQKKLQAGRERLMKFQKKKSSIDKKKKKKSSKKKEDPVDTITPNGDTYTDIPPNIDGDSISNADDICGISDIMSIESDQRSITTDDLSLDEADQIQVEYEVAKAELREAKGRILQLEETLHGKVVLVQQLQSEVNQVKKSSQSMVESEFSSHTEVEYKSIIEQYNSKIYEFQQAVAQRDEIIQQLSVNLQATMHSRDSLQSEATQLSTHIHALQQQLQNAGDTIKVQNGEQSASAHDMTETQMQVISLQETVARKENMLQDLANKYAKKIEDLAEMEDERDIIKRRSVEELFDLNKRLQHTEKAASHSPSDFKVELSALHAELDETYGQQIVMIKSQLQERHNAEIGLLRQEYDELQCLIDTADSNKIKFDQHVEQLNKQLEEKQLDMEALENIQNDFEDQVLQLNIHNKALCKKSETDVKNITQLNQEIVDSKTLVQQQTAILETHEKCIEKIVKEKQSLENDMDERIDDEIAHQTDIHKIALKQQLSVVAADYDKQLHIIKEELEEDCNIRIKTAKTEKEKEFVQELQKVRHQLAESHTEDMEALKKQITDEMSEQVKETQKLVERIEKEKEMLNQMAPSIEANQNQDWIANQGQIWTNTKQPSAWAAKQQREMDDLLEARDALMLQLEDAHRQIENLQTELVSVINDKEMKDNMEEDLQTPEILGVAYDQEGDTPFGDCVVKIKDIEKFETRNEELNQAVEQLNVELHSVRDENDDLKTKNEEFKQQIEIFNELKSNAETNKAILGSSNPESVSADSSASSDILLADKEELQHQLEVKEKDFDAKLTAVEESLKNLSGIKSNIEEERDTLLQQIESKELEIEELTEVRQTQAVSMSKFHDELADYKEKVEVLQKDKIQELKEYSFKKEEYEDDIAQLRKQLNDMKSVSDQQESEFQIRLKELVEDNDKECLSAQSQFEEMRKERDQIESELEEKLHLLELGKEEMHRNMAEKTQCLEFTCRALKDELESERQQYESNLAMYQSGGLDDSGRKSPEMSADEKIFVRDEQNELEVAKEDPFGLVCSLAEYPEDINGSKEIILDRDELINEIETLKSKLENQEHMLCRSKGLEKDNEGLLDQIALLKSNAWGSSNPEILPNDIAVFSADKDVPNDREQLLADKEELQHQLEVKEKDFDTKLTAVEESLKNLSDIKSNIEEERDTLLQQIESKELEIEELTEVRQTQALSMSKFHDELADYKEKVEVLQKDKIQELKEYSIKKEEYEDDIAQLRKQLNGMKSVSDQHKSEFQIRLKELVEDKDKECLSAQSQFEEIKKKKVPTATLR